jgi:hypothetical protein
VVVSGPVAFIWTVIGKYSGVGPLSIWTHAHGLVPLGTRSYLWPLVSASGARVLYLDNLVFTGSAPGDVYVANTDGSGKTKLVAGAQLDAAFNMAFAGETAVVSAALPGDAGEGGATLQAFTPPSWTGATLAVGLQGAFTTNPAGTAVLAQTGSGLSVVSLTGGPGAAVTLDANGVGGLFTSDGQTVVYTSIAASLMSSPSSHAQPTMLVPSGFPSLVGLSPDNAWALGTVAFGAAGPGQGADLYVASATAAGTAETLSMTASLGSAGTSTPVPPVFTADASHLVFSSDPTLTGLSTLHVALPSGANPRTFPDVWFFQPTTAGKIVFDDGYDPTGGVGSNGTADIESLDTTSAAAPTVLVSQADANFFVTADQKTLVYSWSFLSGKSAGIWTLPLP